MAEPLRPRDIVLLVDDSPEALGFLTDALEQSGFSVLIATSGHAALAIVERISPDLILLDAVMPGMDGFETCIKLKASPSVAQVPVIFMTGLTETEHVVHALDSGGVDYLTKPINIDELRARIRVHLSNARSAQSARVALDAAGRHLLAVKGSGGVHWSTRRQPASSTQQPAAMTGWISWRQPLPSGWRAVTSQALPATRPFPSPTTAKPPASRLSRRHWCRRIPFPPHRRRAEG